jgi:signal transduction histidine kinase
MHPTGVRHSTRSTCDPPSCSPLTPASQQHRLTELAPRERLLQAVADGSARLLAADSLERELPPVLSSIAELVRIDRVLVMQEKPSLEAIPSLVVNCGWVGPNAAPLDVTELRAQTSRDAHYQDWLRPLREGRVISATRATAVPSVRAMMIAAGAVSLLLVPIRVGGRHWGHIGIDDCCGERDWSADEITALQLLAGVVGAAITRERSLLEIRQRDALLQALTKGVAAVLTADAINEVLPGVLEDIGKVTRIDRMLVVEGFHASALKPTEYYRWLRSGIGERVNLYQAANDAPSRAAVEEWAQPLSEGRSALASLHTSRIELRRLLESAGLGSLLLVPIMVHGRIWGSVSFDDCGGEREWRSDEISALQVFADLIGAAITRERYVEEQRRLQEEVYAQMQERERMGVELRLAQKLEAVGRLAAGIAHEINTPIQFVGDSVSFLQSAVTDLESLLGQYQESARTCAADTSAASDLRALEEVQERIDLGFLRVEIPKSFERAQQGLERVTSIVRAMKEFAHPDSPEQSAADLNHAIRTTLTVSHSEYRYHAQVETHFEELPEVTCNVGELNQVLLNLIVNAAHAIQDAGKDAHDGRITISTQASQEEVSICVTDNGCGIPEENVEKIFDPFFTTKEVGRGTGQGLAIARSIVVDKHGGAIEVQSTVDAGTRFTLRLPIAGKHSRREQQAVPNEQPGIAGQSESVAPAL